MFVIAAVLELGALFGALTAGTLADRYSRRQSIFFACGTNYHWRYRCYGPDVLMQSSSVLALEYNVQHTP